MGCMATGVGSIDVNVIHCPAFLAPILIVDLHYLHLLLFVFVEFLLVAGVGILADFFIA